MSIIMAGPAGVEFPGQKKNQRMRMRGTKQASADAQKRMRKQLQRLLDEPEKVMPDMVWTGKLPWGRVDPVTKSLKELRKVIDHRTNASWLRKRMMSKRGGGVAKALAGSLVAALDDEIGMVATFKHPIYGNGTFVRKGDAKPASMVGMQHVYHPRLRLLPWEEHAKKGWWLFSWRGGFVCTGNKPEVPTGWVLDQLSRNEFSSKESNEVQLIGDLNPEDVANSTIGEIGYIRMNFHDGTVVGLRGDVFEDRGVKDGFIQPLALGMMPPKISEIVDAELMWRPEGWPENESLPEAATERVKEVLDGWLGLSVPEKFLWNMLKQAVLANLDSGFVVGDAWVHESDVDACIALFSGGKEEQDAARWIIAKLQEEWRGVTIDGEGEAEWLEKETVIRSRSATLHNFIKACWAEFGYSLLIDMGLSDDDASSTWQKQLDKPAPFNNFLKKVVSAKQESDRISRIPWFDTNIEGLCGEVQSLVLNAARNGLGKANSAATKLRKSVEIAAVGWAWLSTHGKEGGNEWHFEQAARDKGGEWVPSLKGLWRAAEELLSDDFDEEKKSTESYVKAMEKFRKSCGEQNKLPSL